MSTVSSTSTSDMLNLLDRQIDDKARLAKLHADTGEKAAVTAVQEKLMAPLAPDAARLLDIKA